MKKRSVVAIVAALTAVSLTVGGTFAYFTDAPEKKTNIFTINSDLEGKIEEEFDKEKAERYIPGDVIVKVPKVAVGDDSVDAYVAMKVDCYDGYGNPISMETFQQKYGDIQSYIGDQYIDGYHTEAWTEIETEGKENFFIYGDRKKLSVLSPGQSSTQIFDRVVVNTKIKEEVSKEYQSTTIYEQTEEGEYKEVSKTSVEKESHKRYYISDEQGTMQLTDVTSLPKFQINVTGYLVQADYNETADAIVELEKLAGVSEKGRANGQ